MNRLRSINVTRTFLFFFFQKENPLPPALHEFKIQGQERLALKFMWNFYTSKIRINSSFVIDL